MKQNNKGFMLVEVIVTSTVIVTAMIGLYASFNKTYHNYETKAQYQNIDAIYATKQIVNYTLINNDASIFLNDIFYSGDYKYLIKNKSCNFSMEICQELIDFYQVENMIIIAYDKKLLEDMTVTNQTFKEYINYIIGYYDIASSEDDYSYLFLTETYDGEDYHYASLRVR